MSIAPASPSLDFASDNIVGVAPRVMQALAAANVGTAPAYGADAWTGRVTAQLSALFEREVAVALVTTGTAANALALSCFTPPWGAILAHEESHIADDECGAPEFFCHGAKLVGLEGAGGKLAPAAVAERLAAMPAGVMRQVQPSVLSISNVTETGLVYRPAEVAALKAAIAPRGLALHMDGARFAAAVAALGCTPAEITWKAGVDVLSFGGSKNGAMAAEAVVFFDPAQAADVIYRHKRSGHVLSKMRFLAAQFEALLAEGHWLALAAHANAMAAQLAAGLAGAPGCRLAFPCEANEVFLVVPRAVAGRWRAAGLTAHGWSLRALPPGERPGPDEEILRFVTSFATEPEQIEAMIALSAR